MSEVRVNNGFRARVSFPFGWEGSAGVSDLGDGRVRIAYQSPLAPPVGFRMSLGDLLLEVRHVSPARTPGEMTTLTLLRVGAELS